MVKKHFGDYTEAELRSMSIDRLAEIILDLQSEDNIILMTDSYKMTHHLLYPENISEVYSYMEPRGGDMPYTVFFGLNYYLKKYLAGVRVTKAKIEQARQKNILHFGFDCFDSTMWDHIVDVHGGTLPLEIKAVPEGTPVAVKNVIMTIRNTDPKCAALTNITETLLMKLWATNTVAAYARIVKELMLRYHAMSSDAPAWLIDFLHHDFGYRGVNSEESARLLGAAALTQFKGTDTMGALTMIERYYHDPMAGFSVIASEHSVHCSYGARDKEFSSYERIIKRVKAKCMNVKPASGVIILSLVSDTNNIYNVCHRILPALQHEFIGWTNAHGIPLKIVVRPDSGDPTMVLFGVKDYKEDVHEALVDRVANDFATFGIQDSEHLAYTLVKKGVFQILFENFGETMNSKNFRVLHPQIGVLQGDGISYKTIGKLFEYMMADKIDSTMLVFGSGGKYLQAHDRDEQKYAIKATHVIIDGVSTDVEKNPVTDPGKKSKKGYLKLVRTKGSNGDWDAYKTIQTGDPGFDEARDVLETVFLNGAILKDYHFDEVRKNAEIKSLVTA